MSALTNPEWAVEAARDKHYQDTPVTTAALLGGATGAAVPLALAAWDAYNRRPVDWRQVAAGSAVLGGVGAVGTSLAELLGRAATRSVGPAFKERRWRHDQDPHRWNSALRLAPLGLLLAAKYPLLKYMAEKQSSASDLAKAEARVKENLSDKEIESGVYPKGHFRWKGLDITIETARGQTRSGTDRNGKAWSIELKNSYGYIKGTKSAEPGDQMDVFIGSDLDSEIVFVIDQNNTEGNFDEHKSVIGVRNSADAKQLYLDNYSKGWKGFRSVTALTLEQFKAWLEKGDMKSPLKGQKLGDFVKGASGVLPFELRRQLPGFHPWETALGTGVGAVGGALYHWIRRYLGQKYRNDDHATLDMLKRVAVGAATGALGSNILADRTRRFISNIPRPVGYDAGSQIEDLKEAGWKGILDGFVKDVPIMQSSDGKGLDNSVVRHLRREIMRRGFNVHTDNPQVDQVKVTGFARDGSAVLGLADRFFDKEHKLKPEFLPYWQQVAPADKYQYDLAASGPGKFVPVYGPLLGNFSARRFGDTQQFLDRWDFDLHQDEKAKAAGILKSWLDRIMTQPVSKNWQPSFAVGERDWSALKTLAARHILDKTVASKMPYFYQSFNVPQQEAGYDGADISNVLPSRIPLFGD